MFYCIHFTLVLSVVMGIISCKGQAEIQNSNLNFQHISNGDKKIDLLISQLSDRNDKVREQAVTSLLDIANGNKESRNEVLIKLVDRFDIFRSNKKMMIQPEEKEEFQSYLKLFLELNAVEALDVMVKYIDSRELITSTNSLIGKVVIQFGEEAIPSLEKGLNNSDEWVRCRCAATLSSLKFKQNKDVAISKAIEVLEKSKVNETNKDAMNCIDQAIMTLNQRKLPNYE